MRDIHVQGLALLLLDPVCIRILKIRVCQSRWNFLHGTSPMNPSPSLVVAQTHTYTTPHHTLSSFPAEGHWEICSISTSKDQLWAAGEANTAPAMGNPKQQEHLQGLADPAHQLSWASFPERDHLILLRGGVGSLGLQEVL